MNPDNHTKLVTVILKCFRKSSSKRELSTNAPGSVERAGAKKNEEVMSFATEIATGESSCRSTAETTPDLSDIGEDIRRIALNLQHPLLQVGATDVIYVVVEDVPAGIRLSGGRCNGDDTWSLAPGDLDGLQAILPGAQIEPFLLSVRILTPDPGGYDYASTTAKFEIIVCPDRESAVVVAARSRMGASAWPRPRLRPAQPSRQSDSMAAEDPRLTAARAEWQVEEEVRSARARAYWESTEEERWLGRESELRAQLSAELAEAEARWAHREASRVAAVEANWIARLATSQARWRMHKEQHRCVALPAQTIKLERTRLRRCIAKLAAPIAFACTFVSVWML